MRNIYVRALVWSGVYVLLLLSLLTPLNFLTVCFVMIPPLIVYTLFGWRRFVVYFAGSLLIVFALLRDWSLPSMLIAHFFLPAVIVLAEQYLRKSPARKAIVYACLALIAAQLVALASLYGAGMNVVQEAKDMFFAGFETLPESLATEEAREAMEASIDDMVRLLPFYMVLFSVFYVSVTHSVGRRILHKYGVETNGLPPVRQWMLPKSMIWYYLAVLLLDLLVLFEENSAIDTAVLNLFMLFRTAFALQAIGFLFYVSYVKRWTFLPVLGIAAFPFLAPLLSILGVLDVAFPLRDKLGKGRN